MFCSNCGNQVPDGMKFCSKCGTKIGIASNASNIESEVSTSNDTIQVTENAPVKAETGNAIQAATPINFDVMMGNGNTNANVDVNTNAGVYTNANANVGANANANAHTTANINASAGDVNTSAPKAPKKKIKPGAIIAIAIAAVLLIAVAIVALNYKVIANSIKKSGKADSYLKWVVKNEVDDQINNSVNAYDSFMNAYDIDNNHTEVKAELTFGDGADGYLRILKKQGYDFGDIDNIGMYISTNIKDETFEAMIGASVNGYEVANVEGILDGDEAVAYLGVPVLTSSFISCDLSDYLMGEAQDALAAPSVLQDATPSSKVIRSIATNYLYAAIDSISSGNVKVKDKQLSEGGISQKVSAVTVTVDNDLIREMLIAILEEMKEDDELEKVVLSYLDAIEEAGLADEYELDDFDYDEMMEEIDDIIDEIEDTIFIEHYNFDDNEYVEDEIEFTLFVDNKGEIVGFEIEYDPDYETYYNFDYYFYTVQQGRNVASHGEFEDFEFTAKGKKSNNKFTGDVELSLYGYELGTIAVSKFDCEKAKKGELSGKFEIALSEELLDELDSDSYAKYLEDLVLVIDADCKIGKGNLTLTLREEDENILSVKLDYVSEKAKEIDIPSENDSYTISEFDEFVDTFDLDAYEDTLVDAYISDDIVMDVIDYLEDELDIYSILYWFF